MKDFLKRYMSAEALAELEQAYVAANAGAQGLPVYISKSRLDEVLGQKKAAEANYDALKKEKEGWEASLQEKINAAVTAKTTELEAAHKKAMDDASAGFAATEAIYKAHGRNVTAIKALIDPAKKVDEEITRIKKSDPYLFEDDLPGGTGKNGGDDRGDNNEEVAKMRAAVGI